MQMHRAVWKNVTSAVKFKIDISSGNTHDPRSVIVLGKHYKETQVSFWNSRYNESRCEDNNVFIFTSPAVSRTALL